MVRELDGAAGIAEAPATARLEERNIVPTVVISISLSFIDGVPDGYLARHDECC
jgi:hypothetical protein